MSSRRALLVGGSSLLLGTAPINSRGAKKYPDSARDTAGAACRAPEPAF